MIAPNSDYALLLESLVNYSRARTIVEIGVAFGYTTALLCRGAKPHGGHVFGFDVWQTHGQRNQYEQISSKAEVEQRLGKDYSNFTLTQINSQTSEFPPLLKKMCPRIDFAFIDGDHSYAGIKNDFDAVYPLLNKAGIVVFHDTLRIDGCREFMLDLRTKYNDGAFDLVDLPWGLSSAGIADGLGILVKRDHDDRQEIHEICSSPSTPQEIYQREREWYQSQRRDPAAVVAQSSVVPSSGLTRRLKMLHWLLGMKWAGVKRRIARKLSQHQQSAH